MLEDRRFHHAFSLALAGDRRALFPWSGTGARVEAGLSVYRNTVAKGRADGLAAQFPTLVQLVGEAWFRDAAIVFGSEHPPETPIMADYGDGFPDWLARFGPARDLPYLAPVARLDRAWSRTLFAENAPVLRPRDVAGLSSRDLMAARADLHPSTSLFWFGWSVPSIWLAHRPEATPVEALSWSERDEGLLMHRPGLGVLSRRVDRAEWAFLDACRDGRALGAAAQAAFVAEPKLDLSALFARLIGEGVFSRLVPKDVQP